MKQLKRTLCTRLVPAGVTLLGSSEREQEREREEIARERGGCGDEGSNQGGGKWRGLCMSRGVLKWKAGKFSARGPGGLSGKNESRGFGPMGGQPAGVSFILGRGRNHIVSAAGFVI